MREEVFEAIKQANQAALDTVRALPAAGQAAVGDAAGRLGEDGAATARRMTPWDHRRASA